MPYKNPEDKKKYMADYNKKYYRKNVGKLKKYRLTRKAEDRQNWRNWYKRKKNEQEDARRKEAIKTASIYKNKLSPFR